MPRIRAGLVEGKATYRYPIRGIFVGCCAATGKLSAKSIAPRTTPVIRLFITVRLLLLTADR